MKRRYKRELYQERVAEIKGLMPHACIGVDVIVGFPGETEADFEETYAFISSLDVSYLHVFTYSERDNTPAASMADVIPVEERARYMIALEAASVGQDIKPFAEFLGWLVEKGMKGTPVAKI
jgi:threonylcarbamoyladenosine tRNA methylthiotransferase MtaB